jgi:hypothetical protein
MNRHLALAVAAMALILSTRSGYAFTPQTTSASAALDWLHGQQSADGMVAANATRTEETVWGIVANDGSLESFSRAEKTPIDALRANIAKEETSAGNLGNLIMAVSAAGLDPSAFAGRNLLQDLQCTYDPQIGRYNAQLFNDAIAILALPHGAAPTKATAYLTSQQQPDGGWEFQAGFGSDTNTTAMAVMALVSAKALSPTVKERALAFFKLHQKLSGGFEYSAPFAPPGDSDPNSDALVIEALLATREDPTGLDWSVEKKNAVADLITFQYANGGFGFNRPGSSQTAAPDAASTTQALPALAARSLPVRETLGSMPLTCPTTTSSSGVSPPTTTTSRLAQTGSSGLGGLAAGLLLVMTGWRVRRRLVR